LIAISPASLGLKPASRSSSFGGLHGHRYALTNAVLVNGASAEKLRLVKDENNNYLAGYPSAAVTTPSVWSLSVITNKNMASDQFLVGDFSATNIELLMRQDATVDIALENEDDFIREPDDDLCRASRHQRPRAAVHSGHGSFATNSAKCCSHCVS
jgi:Phage capsid family